jgi:proteasome accessory factor C
MVDRTAERLDRILYTLPLAIRNGGATLDELADALGCSPADILADLEEVTARAYYHAAGAADQLQILVDGNRVQVFAGREFVQPVRLTPREAMALDLGLRTLAAEAADGDRDRILALATRLEADLATEPDSPATDRPAVAERATATIEGTGVRHAERVELDIGEDGFRGAIAQAVIDRLRCRIVYLRPGDDSPATRDVAPYLLVHAAGTWYVLGHDGDRDDIRVFRMDRIMNVDVTNIAFVVPAGFDARAFLGDAGVYRPSLADIDVRVQYLPRVARWITERMPVVAQPDGSVIVRHRVGDPGWIVRHVLRYGADARVLGPTSIRDRVARSALRLTA